MLSKKELLERLKKHPLYKAALASVDEQQAKRIAAVTEGFLIQAADGMIPIIAQVSDPNTLKNVQRVIKDDGRVVTIDPIVTGSKGI